MPRRGRTITLRGGEVVHTGPVRGPDIVALSKAARLCVADALGVSRRTYARWKHEPMFRRLVEIERAKAVARRDAGDPA